MTPNYINPSQNSHFLAGSSTIEDHDQQFHQFFAPSYPHASSSSHSFHFYFNPTQDQVVGFYNNYHSKLLDTPLHQPFDQGNDESVVAYDSYQVENKEGNGRLKVSLGIIKEEEHKVVGDQEANNNDNSAKWMSSKMRMMHKMKKSDTRKGGDSQKLPFNEGNSFKDSNDHGSNCSSYNSNNLIRVCADCNTTKTPLWRSGPKGPKSLCNACGIRQRKARRALAAAAAAANETTPSPHPPPPPPTTVKIKIHNQKADNKSKNNYNINSLSTVPFKKRCTITTTTTTNNNNNNATLTVESLSDEESEKAKKPGFEDFLIDLSNKLAFHHVFPQDEKEAAILLMALSCGLVHG